MKLALVLGAVSAAAGATCPTERVSYAEALQVLATDECETLVVGGPQLTGAEASALGELLGANTALRDLTIGNDRTHAADFTPHMGTAFLEDAGAAAFAPGLGRNTGLRVLRVTCNWLGPPGGASLAAALKTNEHLEVLHVVNNEVGDEGAAAFAAALRAASGRSALRELHLRHNHIGDAGAAALGKLLAEQRKGGGGGEGGEDSGGAAPALQVLSLAANNVGDAGAMGVAGGMAGNGRITRLGLLQNTIGDDGVMALSAALRKPGSVLQVRWHPLACCATRCLAVQPEPSRSLNMVLTLMFGCLCRFNPIGFGRKPQCHRRRWRGSTRRAGRSPGRHGATRAICHCQRVHARG